MRMFAGFRSLCMILAECRKLTEQSRLYRMVTMCYSEKDGGLISLKIFLRSCCSEFIIMNNSENSFELLLVLGTMMSTNFVVNMFYFILVSYLIICISRSTFLH